MRRAASKRRTDLAKRRLRAPSAPLPDCLPFAGSAVSRGSATQNRISATKRNLCRTFQLSTKCRQLK